MSESVRTTPLKWLTTRDGEVHFADGSKGLAHNDGEGHWLARCPNGLYIRPLRGNQTHFRTMRQAQGAIVLAVMGLVPGASAETNAAIATAMEAKYDAI